MRLLATDFSVRYQVTRPLRLPYHSGSLLRGVLGRALRLHGCAAPESPCAQACQKPGYCAYSRLFDPPVPDPLPHPLFRGATHAPQPLIPLFRRPGQADLQQGDPLTMGLRMLGPLRNDDTAVLLAAVESFAEFPLGSSDGQVEFVEVRQRGARNRVIDVQQGADQEGRVQVKLETPLWIERKGRLLKPDELDFPALFRHTYRRLTMLAALYGELPPDDNARFRTLDALAAGVQTTDRHLRALQWERYTLENDERHPMMGLAGSIVLDGPVGLFLPVLRAAELTHIGKATSHGLGRIRLIERP